MLVIGIARTIVASITTAVILLIIFSSLFYSLREWQAFVDLIG